MSEGIHTKAWPVGCMRNLNKGKGKSLLVTKIRCCFCVSAMLSDLGESRVWALLSGWPPNQLPVETQVVFMGVFAGLLRRILVPCS